MNKKCCFGVIGVIVFCVILGVLLGVLLPRGETEGEPYDLLQELPENSTWYGNEEIRIFRQYLTIPTVHPDINYESCVRFLKKQAASLDLPVSVYYSRNDKNPVVVVMTWRWSDPTLKSIMLNSHTDVVPVFEEMWTHPPFGAEMDEEGRIFARGSQYTKAIGMIYLAAIRALKKQGIQQLKRTFYITFVPDEEMGGLYGMDVFVKSKEFEAMDVGYALDEARVSVSDTIIATNDERCTWRIEFIFHGVTGHGSILFENTTVEKMSYLISKLMERREIEVAKLNTSTNDYTNVTTINLTVIKGGVQGNVIPPELSVVFDVRLAVNADHAEFERQVERREDAEQNTKQQEIFDILVAAGYFRARIKGLSAFDKIVGGMTWCIEASDFDVDVDLLFHENLSIGRKIALTEKIVTVLPKMQCPCLIEPHQIQGLDFIKIFPVVQWLVKRSVENRTERAEKLKRFATSQFQNYFSFECDVKSRDMYANSTQFIKQILSADVPKRQHKRKAAGPDDEKTRVRITLLEYGNKSLIGPSFGITTIKKSENDVVVDDELTAEVY